MNICSVEDGEDRQFTSEELQNRATLLAITKNAFRDLGYHLNGKGGMPVFGYSQPIFYSPRERENNSSLWEMFYNDIHQSLKEGHISQIRSILESHDSFKTGFENVLRQFATGERRSRKS